MFGQRFKLDEIQERIDLAKRNLIDFSDKVPGLKVAPGVHGAKPRVETYLNRIIVENAEYVEYKTPAPDSMTGLATDAFAVDIGGSGIKELHDSFAFHVNADDSQLIYLEALSAQYVTAKNAPLQHINIENATRLILSPETTALSGFKNNYMIVSENPIDGGYGFFFEESSQYVTHDFNGNVGDLLGHLHKKNPKDTDSFRAVAGLVMATRSHQQHQAALEALTVLGLIKPPTV